MTQNTSEFPTLAQYSQTTAKNNAWVNVTLTRTDPDGSKTQTFFIAKK